MTGTGNGALDSERVDAAVRWRLRRGMLELDLMLARFHQNQYADLSADARERFARLLQAEDDRLWLWMSGQAEPDDPGLAEMVRRIRAHPGA